MLALAVLMCLCGVCMGGSSSVKLSDMPLEQRVELEKSQEQLTKLGVSLQTMLIIMGIGLFIPGVLMGVLAIFVRRGGMVAAILALVLTGGLIVLGAISILGALSNGPPGIAGACLFVIPLIGMILLVKWLIQVLQCAPQLSAMRAQHAAYYQQYYYAQQAYQQAYGYGQQTMQQPPQQPPASQGPNDVPPPT
jgi:hypothetical protein